MKVFSITFSAIFLTLGIVSFAHASTTTYTYDSMDRLSTIVHSDETEISYTYDKAGNRVSRVIINKGDSDNDGLKDSWERRYFGDLSQGGADDPDSDCWGNFQEQARGWVPNDKASPGWWYPSSENECK